jgi:hypothetical protein
VKVDSYDVEQQTAAAGGRLGAWTSPSRGHALTQRTFTATVGAGRERCFRARAHDHVGRVSSYGDRWCVVSPVDDRSFSLHGGTRLRTRGALGGAVTRLAGSRSVMVSEPMTGHGLWILAKTDLSGIPLVRWGGETVMGRSGQTAGVGPERVNGFSWYSVHFRHPHRGSVSIAAARSTNWTQIDAIALQR